MKKLIGAVAAGATLAAPFALLPGQAAAQSPLPGAPTPPAVPGVPIPPGSTVDPFGFVFDAAGQLLGIVNSVTGLLLPATAPDYQEPPDPGSADDGDPTPATPSGQPSGPAPQNTVTPVPVTSTPSQAASTSDAKAPQLLLSAPVTTSYQEARTKGILVTARCNEACRVTLRLTRGQQYAYLTQTLQGNRATRLRLKLNPGARVVLGEAARSTRLTLRAQAIDAAGNRGEIVAKKTSVGAGR